MKKTDPAEQLGDAAWEGDINRLQEALKASPDVNTAQDDGETALMEAAGEGHLEAVKRLLESGAGVNATRGPGTPGFFLSAIGAGPRRPGPPYGRLLL